MHCYALVNSGLGQLAQQELRELFDISSTVTGSIVEFSLKQKEQLPLLLSRVQSPRRILIALAKSKGFENLTFFDVPWKELLPHSFSFKVEVENVSGQENRFEIAKVVAGKLFTLFESSGLIATMELKHPELLFVIYHDHDTYYLGLDGDGEIDARQYRVFPHAAAFKGDLAYYFLRASGYQIGEKLVVGFARDGSIAIEAALLSASLPVREVKRFRMTASTIVKPVASPLIFGFDPAMPSIIAARKNAKIAGVAPLIHLSRHTLDELDVKFSPNEIDRLIVHLTRKDEDKINELYYQASYILKPKGTLLIIGRSTLEISAPEKFILVEKKEVLRGENAYGMWLMEKKG